MHIKSILAYIACLAVLVQSVPVPAGQYIKYRISNKYFDQYVGNSPQSKDPIYELLARVHNDKIPHVDATLIKTNEIVEQNAVAVKPVRSGVQAVDHSGGTVVVEVVNFIPNQENTEVVKELVEKIVESNEQPEVSLEMESAEVEQGTEKNDKKTTPTDYEGESLASEEDIPEKIENMRTEVFAPVLTVSDLNEIEDKINSLVNMATEKEPEVEQITEQIKPVIVNDPGHEELENSLNTVYNLFKGNQPEVLEAVEQSTQIADSVFEDSLNKIYGLFKDVVTESLATELIDIPLVEKDIPNTIPIIQTPVEQEVHENQEVYTESSNIGKDVPLSTVQPFEQNTQNIVEKEENTEQDEDNNDATTVQSDAVPVPTEYEVSTESMQGTEQMDEEIEIFEQATEKDQVQQVSEQVDYLDASTDESIVHNHEITEQTTEEQIIDEEADHSKPKPVEPVLVPLSGDVVIDEENDHPINVDPEPVTEQTGIEILDAELAPEVKEFLDTKVDFNDPENFNYKFQFFDDTKIITYMVKPRGLVAILDGEPKYTVYELDAKPMQAIA